MTSLLPPQQKKTGGPITRSLQFGKYHYEMFYRNAFVLCKLIPKVVHYGGNVPKTQGHETISFKEKRTLFCRNIMLKKPFLMDALLCLLQHSKVIMKSFLLGKLIPIYSFTRLLVARNFIFEITGRNKIEKDIDSMDELFSAQYLSYSSGGFDLTIKEEVSFYDLLDSYYRMFVVFFPNYVADSSSIEAELAFIEPLRTTIARSYGPFFFIETALGGDPPIQASIYSHTITDIFKRTAFYSIISQAYNSNKVNHRLSADVKFEPTDPNAKYNIRGDIIPNSEMIQLIEAIRYVYLNLQNTAELLNFDMSIQMELPDVKVNRIMTTTFRTDNNDSNEITSMQPLYLLARKVSPITGDGLISEFNDVNIGDEIILLANLKIFITLQCIHGLDFYCKTRMMYNAPFQSGYAYKPNVVLIVPDLTGQIQSSRASNNTIRNSIMETCYNDIIYLEDENHSYGYSVYTTGTYIFYVETSWLVKLQNENTFTLSDNKALELIAKYINVKQPTLEKRPFPSFLIIVEGFINTQDYTIRYNSEDIKFSFYPIGYLKGNLTNKSALNILCIRLTETSGAKQFESIMEDVKQKVLSFKMIRYMKTIENTNQFDPTTFQAYSGKYRPLTAPFPDISIHDNPISIKDFPKLDFGPLITNQPGSSTPNPASTGGKPSNTSTSNTSTTATAGTAKTSGNTPASTASTSGSATTATAQTSSSTPTSTASTSGSAATATAQTSGITPTSTASTSGSTTTSTAQTSGNTPTNTASTSGSTTTTTTTSSTATTGQTSTNVATTSVTTTTTSTTTTTTSKATSGLSNSSSDSDDEFDYKEQLAQAKKKPNKDDENRHKIILATFKNKMAKYLKEMLQFEKTKDIDHEEEASNLGKEIIEIIRTTSSVDILINYEIIILQITATHILDDSIKSANLTFEKEITNNIAQQLLDSLTGTIPVTFIEDLALQLFNIAENLVLSNNPNMSLEFIRFVFAEKGIENSKTPLLDTKLNKEISEYEKNIKKDISIRKVEIKEKIEEKRNFYIQYKTMIILFRNQQIKKYNSLDDDLEDDGLIAPLDSNDDEDYTEEIENSEYLRDENSMINGLKRNFNFSRTINYDAIKDILGEKDQFIEEDGSQMKDDKILKIRGLAIEAFMIFLDEVYEQSEDGSYAEDKGLEDLDRYLMNDTKSPYYKRNRARINVLKKLDETSKTIKDKQYFLKKKIFELSETLHNLKSIGKVINDLRRKFSNFRSQIYNQLKEEEILKKKKLELSKAKKDNESEIEQNLKKPKFITNTPIYEKQPDKPINQPNKIPTIKKDKNGTTILIPSSLPATKAQNASLFGERLILQKEKKITLISMTKQSIETIITGENFNNPLFQKQDLPRATIHGVIGQKPLPFRALPFSKIVFEAIYPGKNQTFLFGEKILVSRELEKWIPSLANSRLYATTSSNSSRVFETPSLNQNTVPETPQALPLSEDPSVPLIASITGDIGNNTINQFETIWSQHDVSGVFVKLVKSGDDPSTIVLDGSSLTNAGYYTHWILFDKSNMEKIINENGNENLDITFWVYNDMIAVPCLFIQYSILNNYISQEINNESLTTIETLSTKFINDPFNKTLPRDYYENLFSQSGFWDWYYINDNLGPEDSNDITSWEKIDSDNFNNHIQMEYGTLIATERIEPTEIADAVADLKIPKTITLKVICVIFLWNEKKLWKKYGKEVTLIKPSQDLPKMMKNISSLHQKTNHLLGSTEWYKSSTTNGGRKDFIGTTTHLPNEILLLENESQTTVSLWNITFNSYNNGGTVITDQEQRRYLIAKQKETESNIVLVDAFANSLPICVYKQEPKVLLKIFWITPKNLYNQNVPIIIEPNGTTTNIKELSSLVSQRLMLSTKTQVNKLIWDKLFNNDSIETLLLAKITKDKLLIPDNLTLSPSEILSSIKVVNNTPIPKLEIVNNELVHPKRYLNCTLMELISFINNQFGSIALIKQSIKKSITPFLKANLINWYNIEKPVILSKRNLILMLLGPLLIRNYFGDDLKSKFADMNLEKQNRIILIMEVFYYSIKKDTFETDYDFLQKISSDEDPDPDTFEGDDLDDEQKFIKFVENGSKKFKLTAKDEIEKEILNNNYKSDIEDIDNAEKHFKSFINLISYYLSFNPYYSATLELWLFWVLTPNASTRTLPIAWSKPTQDSVNSMIVLFDTINDAESISIVLKTLDKNFGDNVLFNSIVPLGLVYDVSDLRIKYSSIRKHVIDLTEKSTTKFVDETKNSIIIPTTQIKGKFMDEDDAPYIFTSDKLKMHVICNTLFEGWTDEITIMKKISGHMLEPIIIQVQNNFIDIFSNSVYTPKTDNSTIDVPIIESCDDNKLKTKHDEVEWLYKKLKTEHNTPLFILCENGKCLSNINDSPFSSSFFNQLQDEIESLVQQANYHFRTEQLNSQANLEFKTNKHVIDKYFLVGNLVKNTDWKKMLNDISFTFGPGLKLIDDISSISNFHKITDQIRKLLGGETWESVCNELKLRIFLEITLNSIDNMYGKIPTSIPFDCAISIIQNMDKLNYKYRYSSKTTMEWIGLIKPNLLSNIKNIIGEKYVREMQYLSSSKEINIYKISVNDQSKDYDNISIFGNLPDTKFTKINNEHAHIALQHIEMMLAFFIIQGYSEVHKIVIINPKTILILVVLSALPIKLPNLNVDPNPFKLPHNINFNQNRITRLLSNPLSQPSMAYLIILSNIESLRKLNQDKTPDRFRPTYTNSVTSFSHNSDRYKITDRNSFYNHGIGNRDILITEIPESGSPLKLLLTGLKIPTKPSEKMIITKALSKSFLVNIKFNGQKPPTMRILSDSFYNYMIKKFVPSETNLPFLFDNSELITKFLTWDLIKTILTNNIDTDEFFRRNTLLETFFIDPEDNVRLFFDNLFTKIKTSYENLKAQQQNFLIELSKISKENIDAVNN
jgi:hypothetical protein